MITALDDLSVLQNHDGVGVPHGGEAVGDHEGSPFCHQTVHALLDVLFRSRIDGARRFIEDENGRIFKEDAGNGDALLLPAGQERTAAKRGVNCGLRSSHAVLPMARRPRHSAAELPMVSPSGRRCVRMQ